jgi:uncharacterized protein YbjT (DUF2867 family)
VWRGRPANLTGADDPGHGGDLARGAAFLLIDPADIAAVAVRALTEDSHHGKEYLLTGGEALTVADQVQILAAALGRDDWCARNAPVFSAGPGDC